MKVNERITDQMSDLRLKDTHCNDQTQSDVDTRSEDNENGLPSKPDEHSDYHEPFQPPHMMQGYPMGHPPPFMAPPPAFWGPHHPFMGFAPPMHRGQHHRFMHRMRRMGNPEGMEGRYQLRQKYGEPCERDQSKTMEEATENTNRTHCKTGSIDEVCSRPRQHRCRVRFEQSGHRPLGHHSQHPPMHSHFEEHFPGGMDNEGMGPTTPMHAPPPFMGGAMMPQYMMPPPQWMAQMHPMFMMAYQACMMKKWAKFMKKSQKYNKKFKRCQEKGINAEAKQDSKQPVSTDENKTTDNTKEHITSANDSDTSGSDDDMDMVQDAVSFTMPMMIPPWMMRRMGGFGGRGGMHKRAFKRVNRHKDCFKDNTEEGGRKLCFCLRRRCRCATISNEKRDSVPVNIQNANTQKENKMDDECGEKQ